MKTVVGLFNDPRDAEGTVAELARLGLSPKQIGILSTSTNLGNSRVVDLPDLGVVSANPPMLELLKVPAQERAQERTGDGGMRGALLRLGVSEGDAARCVAGVKGGAVLEAVIVDDGKEAAALDVMRRRATDGSRVRPTDEELVIPVVEEELKVGKREIDAGGVRVTTHVSALPVEKAVTIREEHVNIERRIVDRPVGEKEDAFCDRSLEVTAISEEPVVTKRAHVVQEVRVHKDRTERVETVHDTLRHTDVKLTEVPAARTFGGSLKLAPAFEFGQQLRQRAPADSWAKVEPGAKARWEGTNPGTWDRCRDAIRAGWNSIT